MIKYTVKKFGELFEKVLKKLRKKLRTWNIWDNLENWNEIFGGFAQFCNILFRNYLEIFKISSKFLRGPFSFARTEPQIWGFRVIQTQIGWRRFCCVGPCPPSLRIQRCPDKYQKLSIVITEHVNEPEGKIILSIFVILRSMMPTTCKWVFMTSSFAYRPSSSPLFLPYVRQEAWEKLTVWISKVIDPGW